MKVLGIETSCDETGIAIYDDIHGLIGHHIYSQISLHAQYGGVVPELASRDHIQKIIPLIRQIMSGCHLEREDIDGVAYTAGPGLIGALLVGAAVGRSLAWAWQVPAVAIHHMEGHLLAPLLENEKPDFPFVALLVSGGHTLLVDVKGVGQYHILGESLDDAAGEAFDKTAKLLGLPYPGGPELAKLAQQGDPERFRFPRPMMNRPGLDFSFSGLKTYALNTWHKFGDDHQTKADIARAFEDAVIDTLAKKCLRAIKQTQHNRLIMAGGVSANEKLRSQMKAFAKVHEFEVYYPRPIFCTDNGAMIAYAGCLRLLAGEREPLVFDAKAKWAINQLLPL